MKQVAKTTCVPLTYMACYHSFQFTSLESKFKVTSSELEKVVGEKRQLERYA